MGSLILSKRSPPSAVDNVQSVAPYAMSEEGLGVKSQGCVSWMDV